MTQQVSSTAKAPVRANNPAGDGWPTYDVARLVYGAADALVTADSCAREPILAHTATDYRRAARAALVEAVAKLDAIQ